VADWRPAAAAGRKLKKHAGRLTLELEPTEDILLATRPLRAGLLSIGFAAETGDAEPEALRKLRSKGLDMIVANDVTRPGAGFEVETNAVTFITAAGVVWRSGVEPKTAIALRIVEWIEAVRQSAEGSAVSAGATTGASAGAGTAASGGGWLPPSSMAMTSC
jgi:phosphopantothenoylcysteine decarboxylase/phosphopantothenate--cysteine ligase